MALGSTPVAVEPLLPTLAKPLAAIAVLGNNPETVSRHYAHELGRPPMPEF